MKAVVFHSIGDFRLEDVPDPVLEAPTDAVVRLTSSAICGTDLHFVRGTFSGFVAGQILGHEGVGVVESVDKNLTIRMGICNHRRYIDVMFDHILAGRLDPTTILTQVEPITDVMAAYEAFDERRSGWLKVELQPAT